MRSYVQVGSAFVLGAVMLAVGWILAKGVSAKEVPVFILWTIPLALLIAKYADCAEQRSTSVWRRIAAVLIGGLVAFVYALVLNGMMGGYLQAFDFPAVSFWIAAAIGVCAAWRRKASATRTIAAGALASVLVWVALFGTSRAVNAATARHLTVIFATHHPGESPLQWVLLDEHWQPLAAEVTPLLARHLSGALEQIDCASYNEHGPRAFIVIVLPADYEEAIRATTKLPQPREGTFVYLLKSGAWTRIELPGSKSSWRDVVLEPKKQDTAGPVFLLESSRGYLGSGIGGWGNRATCESADPDLR